jgi:DNA-binding LacI/PurR family transcriptional regulator
MLTLTTAKDGVNVSAIDDVARRAGVSKSTASRALSGRGYVSEKTRDRVVRAAAEIGYVASSNAASLVTGRTRNVGIVTPSISRWFFAEVLEGIEAALIDADYDLTLYRLSDDPARRRRVFDYFLVRKRVDAVIAVGIALTKQEVQLLHSLGKPVVGIGGEIDGIATLSIDDLAAARFMTEHLISLGHTRIMHLGDDTDEQQGFHVHDLRLAGVRQALDAAGLSHEGDFRRVPYSVPGGYDGGLTVLADPTSRPTAIIAGCDEIAIGVMIAARQLGILIPSQLSVVGVDGHTLAGMFGLTTLEQHPAAQGRAAVEAVLDRLNGNTPAGKPSRIEMPVNLVVRTSTTAPPDDGV